MKYISTFSKPRSYSVADRPLISTWRPNFLNFLERSLEDFLSKERMQIFKETSLENVFGRI